MFLSRGLFLAKTLGKSLLFEPQFPQLFAYTMKCEKKCNTRGTQRMVVIFNIIAKRINKFL